MRFFKKTTLWRVFEPLLLGSITNIMVNYVFHPTHPDYVFKEFLVAFLLAIPITEFNRKIDRFLENKISWTQNFSKRFIYHLSFLSISLVIILNIIGSTYMWVAGASFYTWKELLTINSITFIVALISTIFKWSTHFYQEWKEAELNLYASKEEIKALKSKVNPLPQLIELHKGNSLFKINVDKINLAQSEFGVVWVYTNDHKKSVFQGTLSGLTQLLPEDLFFKANRNTVIHRAMIASLSSSTYGKINLKTMTGDRITISRLKASTFRKWYHADSISS